MVYLSKLLIILYLSIHVSALHAQNAINSTGGNAGGTGGVVSYSVGQVVFTTISGSSGILIQGVQQPFEISVLTGLEEPGIVLQWSVYPNPAIDFLTLKIQNYDYKELRYLLFDANGLPLAEKLITDSETQIFMESLVSGIYFLKITGKVKVLKTFKIIKN
jgi:hypothetical protein